MGKQQATEQDLTAQKAIASRIKSYRVVCGKTLEEFSDYLGVSVPMIRNLENGDCGFYAHKALKIANFLNIPINTLLAADNLDQEPIILRKNLITTAQKLNSIQDVAVRKNICDMINNLTVK